MVWHLYNGKKLAYYWQSSHYKHGPTCRPPDICWDAVRNLLKYKKNKKQGPVPLKTPRAASASEAQHLLSLFTPVARQRCTLAPPHVQATGWHCKGTKASECETESTSCPFAPPGQSEHSKDSKHSNALLRPRPLRRRHARPVVFQNTFTSPWLMTASRCSGPGLKMRRGEWISVTFSWRRVDSGSSFVRAVNCNGTAPGS